MHPSDAQHGDLGVIQPNDVLLLISNSGKTREILELVELAENLHPSLPLIVITSNKESQLAQMADVEIRVPHFGYSDRIQEVHIKVIHILIELVEKGMRDER